MYHDLARWLEECQVGPGGRWRAQIRMWSREPSGKGLLGDPPALHPEELRRGNLLVRDSWESPPISASNLSIYVSIFMYHDLARWLEECQVGPGGRRRARNTLVQAGASVHTGGSTHHFVVRKIEELHLTWEYSGVYTQETLPLKPVG